MARRHIRLFAVSVVSAVSALTVSVAIVVGPPTVASAAPPLSLAVLAGGERHSLALSADGILWTFGENFSGQLGHPLNNNSEVPNPAPTQVMTSVKAVAAGVFHSMALKTDGTLWTFGDNSCGQLGVATNSGTENPNPTPTQVMSGVAAIAAGAFHSLVLKTDGTLWTFGCNGDGELGYADNASANPTPTQVMTGVAAIAAGAFHSLVLKTDATLWTFGSNLDGQLGTATNSGTATPNPTPTQVLTDIAVIAAGGYHSLAVGDGGILQTFGSNLYGQLGRVTNVGTSTANPTPVAVLAGVGAVAAGDEHSLALQIDGTLRTFGHNFDGQLGRATNVGTDLPNYNSSVALTGVTAIGAGSVHSLAMTNAGALLTFGSNRYGQLGDSTNSGATTPNATPLTVTPPEFRPLVPARLLDSRLPSGATVDGQFQALGLRAAGTTTQLQVAGRGGVAPVAGAAVLNVTVTGAQAAGFITAYPCGTSQPGTSNVNYVAGNTIPNLVISQVGVDGKVCLFNSAATNLIVDVAGYYPILPAFESVLPARLLDTRNPGSATVDGAFQGIGPRAAGTTTQLQVADRGGVDLDAETVVLNVTVIGAQSGGYITVYPCGTSQPNASNINFVAGATIANLVISKIGAGKVCIFTSATTNLIADVSGFYPNGSGFESLVPARLMDSRSPGSPTADGQYQGIGLRPAGFTTQLQVTNRGGVPADGDTAVLNITVTAAGAAGFITVYPCGSPQPNASNLNFVAGATIANLVISKIGASGKVCIYTSAPTHLIADVDGYYAA